MNLQLCSIFLAALCIAPPADDLESLILQYRSLAKQAGPLRNKKRPRTKLINQQIKPILNEIAATRSDAAVRFLAKELDGSIPALVKACAQATGKVDTLASTRVLVSSLRRRDSGPNPWKPAEAESYNVAVLEAL